MSQNKPVRVLLADDEKHIRQLMMGVLKTMNCDVVGEACNGQEAVEQYSELQPDVILLDINMPLMTGIEALREIRKQSTSVIIIMLTSMADLGSVDECIQAGASHYIRKDTPLTEMRKVLEKSWGSSEHNEHGGES